MASSYYFIVAVSVISTCFVQAFKPNHPTAEDLVDIPNLSKYSEAAQTEKLKDYGCLCSDYSCGCCVHLEVPKIGLNDTGCLNISYLYKEYGISFTMTIDNHTIYNETISARNPPPICFSAPFLREFADLCVHFYDLNATKTSLHGCVDIEARLHKIVVGRYKVGCFQLGQKSLGRWKLYHRKLLKKIEARLTALKVEARLTALKVNSVLGGKK